MNLDPAAFEYLIRVPYEGDAAASYESSGGHGLSEQQTINWRTILNPLIPTPIETDERRPRVLDLGCGTGVLSRQLYALGCDVTAVDRAPDMLEVARDLSPLDIKYVEADVEQLALDSDHPFDAIFGLRMVGYLRNPLDAFRSWQRYLRPGGMLALFDGYWSPDGWTQSATQDMRQAVLEFVQCNLPLACQRTPATLAYLMRVANFQQVETIEMSAINENNVNSQFYGVSAQR